MAPIGWEFAAIVWGYALLSFLITDQLKIHFFRLMGHEEALINGRQPYVTSSRFSHTILIFLQKLKKAIQCKNEDR